MSAAMRWALILSVLLLAVPALAQEDRGETGDAEDALALGPDVESTVGPPAGPVLTGAELEAATDALSGIMRCPVCQGLSVNDSPSESARNMKRQIRAMVAAGYDDEQILSYFEAAYGEFIRMVPRAKGFNLLVWFIPAFGLLAGLGMVMMTVRKREDEAATKALPPAARQTARASDESLDPFLAQVRAELGEAPAEESSDA
jgi:cytochrome c-type biogenesis protein CcmH/NrfF